MCPKDAPLTWAVGFRQYIGHHTPNAASRLSCHLPANPLPRLLSLHVKRHELLRSWETPTLAHPKFWAGEAFRVGEGRGGGSLAPIPWFPQ